MRPRPSPPPMSARRRILVTSALPYANGPIHLGHLVEYIQTDIWARFQRLRGHDCAYVCADDAHGTPIMLLARRRGLEPEALIEEIGAAHRRDFADFGIAFDCYHSTHSEENRALSAGLYRRLRDAGHIERRAIRQYYDESAGLFLSDRYLRGECPACGAADQYGDACEICGASYDSTALKNPRSALSGAAPVLRDTEHFFFRLAGFADFLRAWAAPGRVQDEIRHKLDEWFAAGLRDWDISRDAPYFGFGIPDAPGKYFYVWLDAPIGYMASHARLCAERGLDFDEVWAPDSEVELHHFIGKDIAYFHTLFWPALLHGAGHRAPTAVWCHGFLTVNGQKMSKSTGTFLEARTYLNHLDPEYLRYYFAAKLGPDISDLNLNLDDFVARVNSDLIGKAVNLASRCAGFIDKQFGHRLGPRLDRPELYAAAAAAGEAVAAHYEARRYSAAMREIMRLADEANRYVHERRPWELARAAATRGEAHAVCTLGVNLYRLLALYLKPALPGLAARGEAWLDAGELAWTAAPEPLLDRAVRPFAPLLTRLDPKQVTAMTKEAAAGADADAGAAAAAATVSPEDFAKLDLRVARVARAEAVAGADRLLRLELDLGDSRRQVLAGIRGAYAPEELQDRLVVVVANLKPRQMRFGVSEGMILAAGEDGGRAALLTVDAGAAPGQRVR